MDNIQAVEQRFWAKVDPQGVCWEWVGSKISSGYGNFRFKGRTAKAHRVAYELLVGPIPEGMQLDHLCRNRACVCPDHLEVVTHKINSLRSNSKPAQNARKTECIYGHPFTEANTYINPGSGGRGCRTCIKARVFTEEQKKAKSVYDRARYLERKARKG